MMHAILDHENDRGLKASAARAGGGGGVPRPGVADLLRFEGRLEEEIRQNELFVDVRKKETFNGGGALGGVETSPLKSRKVKGIEGIGRKSSSSGSCGSSGKSGSSKSRLRDKMDQARVTGRFEETLNDDDLKFFS